jgi:hypothetical protein
MKGVNKQDHRTRLSRRRKLLAILEKMRRNEMHGYVHNDTRATIVVEQDENDANIIELKTLDEPDSIDVLQIFDFDATLFDTPLPETGTIEYEEKTGMSWPHTGWWGRAESLMEPLSIYPGPAFKDFFNHIDLPNTHTIVVCFILKFLLNSHR